MDWIGVFTAVGIGVAAGLFAIFAKVIHSIFQAGVIFRQEFVTKEEFEVLKEDMQKWIAQIERTLMSAMKTMLDREAQKNKITEEKIDKFTIAHTEMNSNVEWVKKQGNTILTITDEIVNMKNRLSKIENDDMSTVRRVIK